MEAFGMYLLKSAVWLTGFTLIFLVFLRNERFFGLNRAFLLSGIFASIIFPLFTWHYAVVLPPLPVEEIPIPEMTEGAVYIPAPEPSMPFYWWIYILGISFLAFRLIFQTIKVIKRLRKTGYVKNGPIKIVRTPEYHASFSFFSFVFVNPSTPDIEAQEIVNHESGHIQNRHWFDLLLMEFLRILQWFNPFAWVYAHLVRQNHEYLADEIALQRSSNPAIYQAALLNQVFGVPVISLANSFSNSLNKKRFTMMKKKIYSPFRKLRLLMALPLIALVFYAFAKPEYVESTPTTTEKVSSLTKEGKVKGTVTNEKGNPLEGVAVIIRGTTSGTTTDANGDFVLKNVPSDAELEFSYVGLKTQKLKPDFDQRMKVQLGNSIVEIGTISINAEQKSLKKSDEVQVVGYGLRKKDESASSKNDKPSFVVVEQMPEFPGGQPALMKYLRENIKYPTQAKGEKAQGTVVVKFTVNKAGKVKDAKVVRGVHKELDAEALRVISSMPDWNPGKQNGKPVNVEFTIPVEFSLKDNNDNSPTSMHNDYSQIYVRDNPPLILLDGKEISREEMQKLNQNSFIKVNVLKDEYATRLYGEKGKNGVVVITSKRWYESDSNVNNRYFYREVDEKPQFPGGKSGMMRFLKLNMKYPVIASEKGAEGTALVRFTVTETGKIDYVSLINDNDIDPYLESEAIRLIYKMPAWDPGKKNGKAVNVVCTIPIRYLISGAKRSTGENKTYSGDFDEVVVVGYGTIKKQSEPTAGENGPFTNVQQMPEFPGGAKEMMKFINTNLHYPPLAKEKGVAGTVIVQFVITSEGKVDRIKVVRGIGSGCDEEVVRVLQLMPKWIPGRQGDKNVDVYYTLPFRFIPDTKKGEELKPFINVEEMPEFPGGKKEMMKFIKDNMKYPPEAKAQGIEGTVIIQFVVTASGKLDNFKIVRGVNPLLDEEALRVLKLSADWTPGKQGGKPVAVYYTLPFRFSLSPSTSTVTYPNLTPPPPPPVTSGNQGN